MWVKTRQTNVVQCFKGVLCKSPVQDFRRELSGRLQAAPLQSLFNIGIAAVQEAPELAPYAVVCVPDVCSARLDAHAA